MDKVKYHADLCSQLNVIYTAKNRAYGDAFGKTFEELGVMSAVTRMYDKFQRILTLTKGLGTASIDESLQDTLIDLSNYCLMTAMELNLRAEREENKDYGIR